MLEPLLTTEQAAALLGTNRRTLEDWRLQPGLGPRFIKLGRLCRYRPVDLEAFVDACERSHTGNSTPSAEPENVT